VTHPFHPLVGRELVCVGERYNRYGVRLLLRIDDDRLCAVPPRWTDAVAPDPEVVLGNSRGLLRVADLLGLADLVSRLVAREQRARPRNANDVATVTSTTPHMAAYQNDQGIHCPETRANVIKQTLDGRRVSGVIDVTDSPEVPCRSDETEKTRRPQRSKKRAR
jgi:hypothetical protein